MEVRPRQNAFFDRGLTATNYGCLQGDGINRDPIGEAGGINLYAFVGNDPVNYVDPNGEWIFILGIGIVADWFYDRYINPHVQDYIDEHFDCLTQQRLATVGAGIDLARSLKNPLKGIRNLKNFGAAGRKGPTPNQGVSRPHGSQRHNEAIDAEISQARNSGASNIRKNQAQVDIHGNKVGTNRPDVQYDLSGRHHNIEIDRTIRSSERHSKVIPANDNSAVNRFEILD